MTNSKAPLILLLTAIVVSMLPGTSQADLIIDSLIGNVFSEYNATNNTQSSADWSTTIHINVTGNNSLTDSTASWTWIDGTLSGSSLVTAEKTIAARPGGDHRGTSDLTLEFTIAGLTEFSLSGSWGLVNPSGTDDSIRFELSGLSGIVVSDASGGTTGINSDTFAASGELEAGSYTFTISSALLETINNQGTAQAGWTLDFFTLTTVAVPEPSGALAGFALVLACLSRKRSHAN